MRVTALILLAFVTVGWDAAKFFPMVGGCPIATKKYQMSGEEFVRQFYEKDRILRTTNDYMDWPLYQYWWKDRRLDEISLLLRKEEPNLKHVAVSNTSLKEMKFSEAPMSFSVEITNNDTVLADSVLIPIPVLSCRDLFHEFKDTANYSLHFSNVNASDFGLIKANVFVMVISGEWQLIGRDDCKANFHSGQLLYIPRGLQVQSSKSYGKFLAVQISWGYLDQKVGSKEITCRPVTLQSAGFRQGWSRNTSKAAQIDSFALNTGFSIPPVGLGTASLGQSAYEIVSRALHVGYRLIETSKVYQTKEDVLVESEIGRAIADADIPRAEIFVSLRIPLRVVTGTISNIFEQSLENTHLPYIDLIVLELPVSHDIMDEDFAQFVWIVWNELVQLRDKGKVRSLGMSNVVDCKELEIIRSQVGESLSVVQNWFDILRTDDKIRDGCKNHGIVYMGYGVLGFERTQQEKTEINRILNSPHVVKFAKQNDVPRGSALLRWAMLKGVVVTPSSVDEYHLESNFYSTQLSMNEMTFEKDEIDSDSTSNPRHEERSTKEEL